MKKLWLVSVIVGVTALLMATTACGGGDSEETQRQIDTASGLSSNLDQLQQEIDEKANNITALEGRFHAAQSELSAFTASAAIHALDRTATIPDPPSGKAAFRLRFEGLPEPLPGRGIQVYETTSEVNTVWAMESLEKGQPLPVGLPIEDGILFMAPGESRTVTLAYENPTAEEVGFLVMPHQESPWSLANHFWPTCLCMSFTYKSPPEGSWYRVIRITAGPDMPPGSKVDSVWPVLTDPSVFPHE